LSCPNDGLNKARGYENPFHLQAYTLKEFQIITTEILGPASAWYIGTPLQGTVIEKYGSETLANEKNELELFVRSVKASTAALLPAQLSHRVDADTCSFYLGIWGGTATTVQVAAPMSHKSFVEPYEAVEWLAERASMLEAKITEQQANIAEQQIAAALLEQQISNGREQIADYSAKIGALEQKDLALSREICEHKAKVIFLEKQILDVRRMAVIIRDLNAGRIQELEKKLSVAVEEAKDARSGAVAVEKRLLTIEGSRGYRLLQRYYAILDGRGGSFLRVGRRAMGYLMRILRTR
jgi:hypothetical protein